MLDIIPDQITIFSHTGIVIGAHGAALTNQLWMRPHRGAVVEIFYGANYHYRNMAFELGHKHFRVQGLNTNTLKKTVVDAMDHVASKY